MNLAHLFLARTTREGRVGSLLADFTNGTIADLARRFSPAVAESILHHREVDRFTDTHPAVNASSRALAGSYGLYSGIVVDVVFDHFLLRHWGRYTREDRGVFYDSIYSDLGSALGIPGLPERFRRVVCGLVERRWLEMYLDLDKLGIALARIGERFPRTTPLDGSVGGIRSCYGVLEDGFLSFFPELIEFFDSVHRGQAGGGIRTSRR